MPEPVTTAAIVMTSMSLGDFLIGIAGNLVARHGDPAADSLAAVIYQRLSKGGFSLPPNHDVERACRESLKQALTMLAQALELRVHRPANLFEAFSNRHDQHGRWKPILSWWKTDEGAWFEEFVREIQTDESLQLFRLPLADASSLNQSIRNLADERIEEFFRKTLLDWTERRVQSGKRPECFEEFVNTGWPMSADKPGVRVTLYQVWSLFLQDHLKTDEKVFRILTADWLASIDSRLKDIIPTREDLIAALQEPLGELRDELVGRLDQLHEEVAGLSEQLGGVGTSLGELLTLVGEYHIESRRDWDELKSVLSEHLTAIRDGLSKIMHDTSAIKDVKANTAAILRGIEELKSGAEQSKNTPLVNPIGKLAANNWKLQSILFPADLPATDTSGFLDCRDAFHAFDQLLKPDNNLRILLLEGEGEHGKSELTSRFFAHTAKHLAPSSAAFIRFSSPVREPLQYLEIMFDSLGVPVPKTGPKNKRSRTLLDARAQLPTVLFVDGFDHTEDEHRLWLDDILTRVMSQPLLRIVIAGRRIPAHRNQPWAIYARHVHCDPFQDPNAFIDHATCCGSTMSAEEIRACCVMMRRQRDQRKQRGHPTDGLSPFTLICEINGRRNGGANR